MYTNNNSSSPQSSPRYGGQKDRAEGIKLFEVQPWARLIQYPVHRAVVTVLYF